MKAANFRYERPASLEDALRVLDSEGPAAKLIAGGQSLGPMLNLRVVQPPALIDISALPEEARYSLADPSSIHCTFLPGAGTHGKEGAPDA